jgi:hypothetical protein
MVEGSVPRGSADLPLVGRSGLRRRSRAGEPDVMVDFTPGRPLVMPGVQRMPSGQRPPTRSLTHRARRPYPPRDLGDTADRSLMARPGSVGSPASGMSAPRGARPYRHAGLPDPPDHPGDHAPRRGELPCCRPRRVVPPALADRHLTGASQDHEADGGVARPNRAKCPEGTHRLAIVYNLVRTVMRHSAMLQHITVERSSFLDALRWLGAPSTGSPLGALSVNPTRPHRVQPRVKKRRPKGLPLMIKPRQALRQQFGTARAQRLTSCHSGPARLRDLPADVPLHPRV